MSNPLVSLIVLSISLINCSSAPDQDQVTDFSSPPVEFNHPPEVKNVNTSFNSDSTEITITFTGIDQESDPLDIELYQIFPNGEEALISENYLSGDIGSISSSDSPKKIHWNIKADPSYADYNEFRLKIVATDDFTKDISELIDLVNSSRIKNDIQNLQGVRHYSGNPTGLENTRKYIRDKFRDHNIEQSDQIFSNRGTNGINIIGSITGQKTENDYYIIDGHYDTIPSTPGADDNASGTAGMLEAMRVLSQFNFKKGIRFIGFDMEELGLIGSRYYARNISNGENILGMINFEMIGYTCKNEPECRDFVNADSSIYNIRSSFATEMSDTFLQIGRSYVPQLKITPVLDNGDPNFRRSDHAPFWDIGVDALFIADGANFRNPHYHQPTDKLITLDIDFVTNIVKTAVGTIATMADFNHSGSSVSELIQIN